MRAPQKENDNVTTTEKKEEEENVGMCRYGATWRYSLFFKGGETFFYNAERGHGT